MVDSVEFHADVHDGAIRIPEEYLKQLKFSACLPQSYAKEIVKSRLFQRGNLETILGAKKKVCVH